METLRIYFLLALASIRSRMEYKTSFIVFVFAIIFFYLGQLGLLFVILARFKEINGWTLGEMAFLYGLMTFSSGFTALVFSQLNFFDQMIVQGNFDRCLVRPLSPLGQVLFSRFEPSTVAHLVIGAVALYYGTKYSGVEWTLKKTFFFPFVVVGGVMIYGSIRIMVSAVAFWTLRNQSLVHTVVYSSKEFIIYPITIYNFGVQFFLTFLFPLAFVNFYPAHFFLDLGGDNLFHPALQVFTPVVGLITFLLAILLWRTGINHYQSTGS